MANRLERIPGQRFSLYADDITLWAATGCEVGIEETLQAAADLVTECAGSIGLSYAPKKSELLVIRSPYIRKALEQDIRVLVEDVSVPEVQTLRMLGMQIGLLEK